MVDQVQQAFDEYRAAYPPRDPNLANKTHDDELRLLRVDEGRRDLTVAPATAVATNSLPRSRGAQHRGKYLWVVGLNDVPYALEAGHNGPVLELGRVTHTNLTGGGPAHAGGEMWFLNTSSVVINGGSSRYRPGSLEELEQVATAFKRCGYRTGHMGYDEETASFARYLLPGVEPEWM